MGIELPHLRPSAPLRAKRLEELYEERDEVSWYWRVIALASSWMILGGYLILPSTYYKPNSKNPPDPSQNPSDPNYRFNTAVLSIVIVALLTAGYSLTALLWFAIRSLLFQAEAIFLPALASSTIGLLSLLYAFLSSSSYRLNTIAILHIVISVSGITAFSFLLFTVNRKISRIRATSKSSHSTRTAGLYADPEETASAGPGTKTFHDLYIANHFPQARPWVHQANDLTRSGSYSSYGGGTGTHGIGSYNPVATDDEAVNMQMALLLHKQDQNAAHNESTYQLEWPLDEEETPNTPLAQSRRRENSLQVGGVREYYANTRSNSSISAASGNTTRPRAESGSGSSSMWSRISGRGGERGRSESSRNRGHVRAKSREERRREIELGTIGSPESSPNLTPPLLSPPPAR